MFNKGIKVLKGIGVTLIVILATVFLAIALADVAGVVEIGLDRKYDSSMLLNKDHYLFIGSHDDSIDSMRYLGAYYRIGNLYLSARGDGSHFLRDSDGNTLALIYTFKDGKTYHNVIQWFPIDVNQDSSTVYFYSGSDNVVVNGSDVNIEQGMYFETSAPLESIVINGIALEL